MTTDQVVYGYLASEENYPEKAVIIEEGTKGNWVYVVLKGQVKVRKSTPKGFVTVDTLGEGAVFGEMALFEKGEGVRTASVITETPVRLGVLDTERLVHDYESLSPQLKDLMRSLITRLKVTTTMALALALEGGEPAPPKTP
jgi:CRP-like cAMP-binding protein